MTLMKVPEARAMIVEFEEVEALKNAERVLGEVQASFGTECTIQALETGEIITGEEIARARAILDFIANYRMVQPY